jgi:hypothetical protein
MRPIRSLWLVVGVSLLAVAGPAAAQDGTEWFETCWIAPPGEPGVWFSPLNWSDGVPNEKALAYVQNGGTAVIHEKAVDPLAFGGGNWGAQAWALYIGGPRSGVVELHSGALSVGMNIQVGQNSNTSGELRVFGGSLTAGSVFVASGPSWYIMNWTDPPSPAWTGGTVRQTDGTAEIAYGLYVGTVPTNLVMPCGPDEWTGGETPRFTGEADPDYFCRPGALYELAGGELTTGWTYVGYSSKGRFLQTNGSHVVKDRLYVGGGMAIDWLTTTLMDPAVESLIACPWFYNDGLYTLQDGKLWARSAHVGQQGSGRFVQNGGACAVETTLQVGGNWGWWSSPPYRICGVSEPAQAAGTSLWAPNYYLPAHGTYELNRGSLATGGTDIGVGGFGQFVQTGGTHRVGGTLRVGGHPYWPIYRINDPALLTGGEQYPAGGGQLAGGIFLPPWWYPGPSRGSYAIRDGELYAARLEVGAGYRPWPWEVLPTEIPVSFFDATSGGADDVAAIVPWLGSTFQQTGGSVAVQGGIGLFGGRYELQDGKLTAGSVFLMGRYVFDRSRFVQSGGACRIEGTLRVGAHWYLPRPAHCDEGRPDVLPNCGWEVAVLSGGELRAGDLHVGGAGKALLCQTGGELTVDRLLYVGGRHATCSLVGGSARVGSVEVGFPLRSEPWQENARISRLHVGSKAKIRLTGELAFGAEARFTAERVSTIHMDGADLKNYSTDPLALAGLDALRLAFTLGPEDDNVYETFEVAGKDLGFSRHGFFRNFVLYTLQVGALEPGTVQLVDEYDNQPGFNEPEALYVWHLIVGPGSKLDLNDLHLYYLQADIDQDAEIIGKLQRVPALLWDEKANEYLNVKADFAKAPSSWASEDRDGDGDVDFVDYAIARDDPGGESAGGAPLPEPTCLALLAAGALVLLRRRRA